MSDFETIRFIAEMVLALFVTPLAFVLWWMLRRLVGDVRELEKALSEFKLHASETYSTKNDLGKAIDQFSRSIDAVFAKLDKIDDKLYQGAART
jgi:hypothetical protein